LDQQEEEKPLISIYYQTEEEYQSESEGGLTSSNEPQYN